MTSIFHFFFFFNDTATTEIYTLSLHDALPICLIQQGGVSLYPNGEPDEAERINSVEYSVQPRDGDRKSTRLNSSHSQISYAVFCLKKKKIMINRNPTRHTAPQLEPRCSQRSAL